MNTNNPRPRVSKKTAFSLSCLLGIGVVAWGLLLATFAVESYRLRIREDHRLMILSVIAILLVPASGVVSRKAVELLIRSRRLVGVVLVIPMILASLILPPLVGLVVAMGVLMSGFESAKPSISDVRTLFVAERKAAEELREMIMEDVKGKGDYQIGLDRIGYFFEFDGQWSRASFKYSLENVLRAEGISAERYSKYKALLGRLRAERVYAFEKWPLVGIELYSFNFLSPTTEVVELVVSPVPLTSLSGPGRFREVTNLGGGWYRVRKIE